MVIERQAARAVLVTTDHEVLLFRIRSPEGGEFFWITPGGGLDRDETVEQGLRRELREELGLEGFVIGPLVWRRQHTFSWGDKRFCQSEEYYVVHVDRFEPCVSDAAEMQVIDGFRWWALSELAQSAERLTPLSLPSIVAGYLAHGAPSEPLELEVLVD